MGMNDVIKFPDMSSQLEKLLVKAVDDGIKKAEQRVKGRTMTVNGMHINVDKANQDILNALEKSQKEIENKKDNIQKTLDKLYSYKPTVNGSRSITDEQKLNIESQIKSMQGLTAAQKQENEKLLKQEAKLVNQKNTLSEEIKKQQNLIKNGTYNSKDVESYYQNVVKLYEVMKKLQGMGSNQLALGYNVKDIVKGLSKQGGGLEGLLSKAYDNELNGIEDKIQQVYVSAQQGLVNSIVKGNPLSSAVEGIEQSKERIKQANANITNEMQSLKDNLVNVWNDLQTALDNPNVSEDKLVVLEEKVIKIVSTLQKYGADMSNIPNIGDIMEGYKSLVGFNEKTSKPTLNLDLINNVKNKVIDDNQAIIASNEQVIASQEKYISSMNWVNDTSVRAAYGDAVLGQLASEMQTAREENERLKQSLASLSENKIDIEQFKGLQSQLEESNKKVSFLEEKIQALNNALTEQKALNESLNKASVGTVTGKGTGIGTGTGTTAGKGTGTGTGTVDESYIDGLQTKINTLKESLLEIQTLVGSKFLSNIASDEDVSRLVSLSTSISEIARDLGKIDFTKLDVSTLNPDNANIFNSIINNFKTSLSSLVTVVNQELANVKLDPSFNKEELLSKIAEVRNELQNNPITVAINEVQLSAALNRLKVNVANIADNQVIEVWKGNFISAIDDIISKIDRSFLDMERSSVKNMIQRWQNEQAILNDTRKSYISTTTKDGKTVVKEGGYGSLERKAFMNTKTGYITADVYDQANHVTQEVSQKLLNTAKENVNAALHSHPSGSASFSSADISAMSHWINQGIVESYVVGAQNVAKINLEGVSSADIKKIADEYDIAKKSLVDAKNAKQISSSDFAIKAQDLLAQSVNKVLGDNSGLSRVQTLDLKDFDSKMLSLERAKNESQQLYTVIQNLNNLLTGFGNKSFTFGISEESLNGILTKLTEILETIRTIYNVSSDTTSNLSTNLKTNLGINTNTSTGSVTTSANVDAASGQMTNEASQAEVLKQKILEVKNAIVAKNTAFSQEASIVASSVSSEVNQLKLLHTHLRVILQTLQTIQATPIKLNIAGIEGSINSQEYTSKIVTVLKNSLNGLDPALLENLSTILKGLSIDASVAENMQKLANAILNLKGNLNNVSLSSMDFLNSIKEIIAQGEALNNLVTVLNTTKEKLDDAKQSAKDAGTQGTKKDTKDTSKGTPKDTGTQKTLQDISSIEQAYQHLMETEKQYQQLRAKVDTGVATKEQIKAFESLKSLREQDNAKIQEAIGLTGEQATAVEKLQKAYDEKAKGGKSTYDSYVNTINSNKILYESQLNTTQQLMQQVFNPNVSGFENLFERAKAEVDELNQKLLQGNISNIQTGYTDKINKIVGSLRNVVAVAMPYDIQDANRRMLEYAQTINNGNVQVGNFTNNNRTLNATFKDQKGLIQEVAIHYNEMTGAITSVGKGVKKSQTILTGFADGLKARFRSLLQYLTIFVSYYRIIGMFKKGIGYVRELDTALTEMRKVSDETVETLRNFQDVSFDIANSVGTTGKQIQNSTADFMRLGESLKEATESAKVANILLNVSEFEGIDEATESLISMSSAFDDLEKIEIVDKLNQVGNNFAISTDGLATALQSSASALKTAKNDLDESIALATAGNAVVQDPNKVGTGLRTIALRITGTEAAKEELAELGEDVDDFIVTTSSKLNEDVQRLTKVKGKEGISLLDDNGNYRSTYKILQDIADVWEQIAEEDLATGQNRQNALLEMLAGKNRSNILASILQNPDVLRDAYESSAFESENSAQDELEKYLDSIEGKIQQFTNEVQEFWHGLIDSETVKFFVDAGTKIIDVIGKITSALGEFGTVAAVAGLGFGISALKSTIKASGGRTKVFVLIANMPPNRLAERCASSGVRWSGNIFLQMKK